MAAIRFIGLSCLVFLVAACGDEVAEPPAPAEPISERLVPAPDQTVQVTLGDYPPLVFLCQSCHGDTAPSPFEDVPTIHGLPDIAIENALYDFRAGVRPCRVSACGLEGACPDMDMCSIIEPINDTGIRDLAHWYAEQPYAPADEAYDPELAARGRQLHEARCENCHADGGTAAVDEASLLRGQRKAYLKNALEDYRNERRVAVGMMDAHLKILADEEITALVEFYASRAD